MYRHEGYSPAAAAAAAGPLLYTDPLSMREFGIYAKCIRVHGT